MVLVAACSYCGLIRDLIKHGEFSYQDEVYRAPTDEEFSAKVEAQRRVVGGLQLEPGDALEVGCNAGYLLAALREAGWKSYGIETSKACADYARRKGFCVTNSSLQDAPLQNESFDLILMSHVLEHIPDPCRALSLAWSSLRPGAHLYIAVPNYGSPVNKYVRAQREMAFIPGQHLWYFTKKTLSRICGDAGFETISLKTCVYMEAKSKRPFASGLKRLAIAYMHTMDAGEEISGLFRKPANRPTTPCHKTGLSSN